MRGNTKDGEKYQTGPATKQKKASRGTKMKRLGIFQRKTANGMVSIYIVSRGLQYFSVLFREPFFFLFFSFFSFLFLFFLFFFIFFIFFFSSEQLKNLSRPGAQLPQTPVPVPCIHTRGNPMSHKRVEKSFHVGVI